MPHKGQTGVKPAHASSAYKSAVDAPARGLARPPADAPPRKKAVEFKRVVPPRVSRLSDVIASQLETMIVQGQLVPGEGLPSERELAKRLGVSRPSLREALSKLRSRGLIEPARNGGAVITELTRVTVTDPLSQILDRHPSAMRDLIEMRGVLEADAASMAAVRATDTDVKKLSIALEAQKGLRRKNVATLARRDLSFHQAVAQASHNIALLHTTHGLAKLLEAFIQRGYNIILSSEDASKRTGDIHEQHLAIFEAICRKDAPGARRAVRAHLHKTEHIWKAGTAK